ncbi:Uncharacterised protein, partial [Mycoplasmopsis synoviae]
MPKIVVEGYVASDDARVDEKTHEDANTKLLQQW